MSARHKWPHYWQFVTDIARPEGVACLKCGVVRQRQVEDLGKMATRTEISTDSGATWERLKTMPPCGGGEP